VEKLDLVSDHLVDVLRPEAAEVVDRIAPQLTATRPASDALDCPSRREGIALTELDQNRCLDPAGLAHRSVGEHRMVEGGVHLVVPTVGGGWASNGKAGSNAFRVGLEATFHGRLVKATNLSGSMSARTFVAFLAVLAVIGLLGFGLLSKGRTTLAVGDPVPDRELPLLDGHGQGAIADYRGRWVLVNLWASWCNPCRREAPVLERLWRRDRRHGLTVLGIDVQDNSEDARAFAHSYGITYPQLRSVGDERSTAFGSTGVPENFLVDPQGRLALIWRGPVDKRFLDEHVTPIIEGSR